MVTMRSCIKEGDFYCRARVSGNKCSAAPRICIDITDTNYQPAPKPGGQIVYTELIKDVEARAEFGRDKYDQYLMTFDGRDTPVDAYQESLDVCFYIKKMLMERDLRCEWELTIDGYYKTTCEVSFVFNYGGPIENKYNFCPCCGKQIKTLLKMEDDGK